MHRDGRAQADTHHARGAPVLDRGTPRRYVGTSCERRILAERQPPDSVRSPSARRERSRRRAPLVPEAHPVIGMKAL